MKRRILIMALCFLAGGMSLHAAVPTLQVVGFQDSLTFRMGREFVQLTEGSIGFKIPAGVKTTIVSGNSFMIVEGTYVSASPGDSFSFLVEGDSAQILVIAGDLEVTEPGRPASILRRGEVLSLKRAGQPAPPVPVVQPPVSPEPPRPAPPEQVKTDHPLEALGDVFYKMARLRPPELKLVVDLHPFYAFMQSYDTNIYRVPKDNIDSSRVGGGVLSSVITQNTIGTRIDMPLNRHNSIESIYEVNFIHYSQQSSANNTLNQHIGSKYSYTGRRGVSLGISEDYVNTEDPAFSEIVIRKKRYQNTIGLNYDSTRHRTLAYGWSNAWSHHKYLDDTLSVLLNRYEINTRLYVGLKLQENTKIYMDFERHRTHYSARGLNHSKSNRIGLGLDGRLLSKLKGRARVGAHLRNYDELNGTQPRSQKTFVLDMDLTYEASPRTRYTLGGYRSINESTYGNNRFYVATGALVGVGYSKGKWSTGLNGSYGIDTFGVPTSPGPATPVLSFRRDTLMSASVNAAYRFKKWLAMNASHQRQIRESNLPAFFDYRTDTTSLNIRVEF